LHHFVSYKLRLLDVSQAQRCFLWRHTWGVKTFKKRCNSSSIITLNTSWYVHSTIFFCKLLFSWIEFDDFLFNFQETFNNRLRRDMGMIIRPTRISIKIYGWRQDCLVYPIELGCTESLTLWSRTCKRPVVSQPLGALNQYRAPSLNSLWPCNNTQLVSPKNMSNSRWIMNNSVKRS
jgi:hypothetical protein